MIYGSRTGFPPRRRSRLAIAAGGGGAGALLVTANAHLAIEAAGGGAGRLGAALTAAASGGGSGRLQQKMLVEAGGGGAGFLSVDDGDPVYSNGYEHFIEFLIPAESVKGGGTLNNCLICIDETLPDLRTVTNGGHVAHASGYDMQLELAGGTVLPFARLVWSASTGRLVARARIASLAVVDTRLRLFFGKTVSADGANPGGAYAAHLAAPDIVTGADRTGLARTWTPTGLTSGSLAGYAATFDGASSQLVRANPTELNGLGAITVQALVQLASVAADVPILMAGPTTGSDLGLMLYFHAATGRLVFRLATSGGMTEVQSADGVMPAAGAPLLVAARWASGQAPSLYAGGALLTPSVPGSAISGTTAVTLAAAASAAVVGYNRLTGNRLAGQIADLMVSARSLSEGHLQTQELNYLAPRDSYGVGERNGADTVNLSPVTPPIFATATVGSDAEVDPALEAYEADVGQVKTLESHTGTAGGTFSRVGGRARFRASAAGEWRSTAVVADNGSPVKRSAASIIWLTTAAPSLLYPEAPFTPASVIVATDAADFAAKYNTTLAAGQHLQLPAGTVALPDGFAFNRTFAAPGVAIVGAGMAANGRDPLTIIPSKDLTVTKDWHAFHQLQFTYSIPGSNGAITDANPFVMRITAAYFGMTKCWFRGNRGIFFADNVACHDNYIGWNRFSTAVPQGVQFVKWKLANLPTGSVKHRNSIFAHNYVRATGPSDDNNAYTIYIGDGHATGGDDRYIQGFKLVNNLFDSPSAGWDKAIYLKSGVEEISGNTILNGTQSFIMRHGSIRDGADATTSLISCQKMWNNYFDVSFFILGGAGHDVRGNYIKTGGGLRIDCGWTQGSGGQFHDAASYSLFVGNQIIVPSSTKPYRLGYYENGTHPTDRRGGKLRQVKIWGHLPASPALTIDDLIFDAATVEAASLGLSTSLGPYPDPGMATALAQTQVGFKVAGQNNG